MTAAKPRSNTATIPQALLVDDDKLMLAVIADLLQELGVGRVVTAANGAAAAQAFDRQHPAFELVVCDLNMPGGDGFQFMELLGARGYGGGVVLVSGMDDRVLNSASLMARFHRLNILATLKKPVEQAALAAALARLRGRP